MRRPSAAALAFFFAALPLCAQRGGGGHAGGFSGHSAPSFHSAPAPSFHYSPGLIGGGRPSGYTPAYRPGYVPGTRYSFSGSSTVVPRPTTFGRPIVGRPPVRPIPPHPVRFRGPLLYPGFYGAGLWGYPDPDFDLLGYDDLYEPQASLYSSPAPDANVYASSDPSAQPQPSSEPAAPEAQPAQPDDQPAPTAETVPPPSEYVILVFKDGRPPLHIQNYIATSRTITVVAGSRHYDIPVDSLDLPATVKTNRDAGVDFRLPDSPQ